MPWLAAAEDSLNWWQKLCLHVISWRRETIPKHVAFIMDGNRRYAVKTGLRRPSDGHQAGFNKLTHVLDWCLQLGVQQVTVYAFALENFQRSTQEVDALLRLAADKFRELLAEHHSRIMQEGVRIRVFGELHRLPADLQRLIARTVVLTRHNARAVLNIALAYSARAELTGAVHSVFEGVVAADGKLDDGNCVSEELLGRCLHSALDGATPPDMVVRTSGEHRFSDFLLWQSAGAYICFTPALWPEFTVWHLLAAIYQYQRNAPHLRRLRSPTSTTCNGNTSTNAAMCNGATQLNTALIDEKCRIQNFVNDLRRRRLEWLEKCI